MQPLLRVPIAMARVPGADRPAAGRYRPLPRNLRPCRTLLSSPARRSSNFPFEWCSSARVIVERVLLGRTDVQSLTAAQRVNRLRRHSRTEADVHRAAAYANRSNTDTSSKQLVTE